MCSDWPRGWDAVVTVVLDFDLWLLWVQLVKWLIVLPYRIS